MQNHTTAGIRWWSPTQLLICGSEACVWQSGRDAQFSRNLGTAGNIQYFVSLILVLRLLFFKLHTNCFCFGIDITVLCI
jgi:hypothetical protein